ncbi:uncharacterized protein LTR77_006480 [Saxophila tyrrhenica]|uniref:DUF4105 domain-containing protein n=1 Tax=Saxophila tyrrhenica TaxID=1690608 RepID=A0AAV9P801_9PEZI|nr:hypothetical protein LTR77_006480 [Saxophila tyrrhenica]
MGREDYSRITLWLADLESLAERGINTLVGARGVIAPSAILSTSFILHWALEVRGSCYEVTKIDYSRVGRVKDKATFEAPPLREWWSAREHFGLRYVGRTVGATELNNHQILARARKLWGNGGFFRKEWKLFRNCQNFAHMLFEEICAEPDEFNLRAMRLSEWQRMPNPASNIKGAAVETGLATMTLAPIVAAIHAADARGMRTRDFLRQHPKSTVAGVAVTGLAAVAMLLYQRAPERYQQRQLMYNDIVERAVKYAPLASPALFETLRAKPAAYKGYNMDNINIYAERGYPVREVVAAFEWLRIAPQGARRLRFTREVDLAISMVLYERWRFRDESDTMGRGNPLDWDYDYSSQSQEEEDDYSSEGNDAASDGGGDAGTASESEDDYYEEEGDDY